MKNAIERRECSHGHPAWRLGRCVIGHKANLTARYLPATEVTRLEGALRRIQANPEAAKEIADQALNQTDS